MNRYFSKKFWLEFDMQQAIGNMLRAGVLLSATVASVGGIMYVFKHGTELIPIYTAYKGEPAIFRSIPGVLKGTLALQSSSIMQLGVLLLIATPIFRVLFSFFAFLLEKDYLYTVITFIVLSIITFSMLGGIAA